MTSLLQLSPPSPTVPIPENRLTRNFISYQYSATMRRPLVLEGPYEPLYALLFDMDPEVVCIQEQPLRIQEKVDKRWLDYTFDLCVRYRSGESRYYEVKPTSRLVTYPTGLRAPPKWDRVHPWSEKNGVDIGFLTEEPLKGREVYIQNATEMVLSIQQFQKCEKPKIVSAVAEFMQLARETTLGEVLHHLDTFSTTELRGALFDGIRRGRYQCDAEKNRLSGATRIELSETC